MKPIDPKRPPRLPISASAPFYTPFVYPDGWRLGDAVLQLDDRIDWAPAFTSTACPPGMTTRSHRHNGHEQFLILEGELHESDGTILRGGRSGVLPRWHRAQFLHPERLPSGRPYRLGRDLAGVDDRIAAGEGEALLPAPA
jgi:hypothetical protein